MKNLIYIKYRDIQQNSNHYIEIMLIQKIGDSPQNFSSNQTAKLKNIYLIKIKVVNVL